MSYQFIRFQTINIYFVCLISRMSRGCSSNGFALAQSHRLPDITTVFFLGISHELDPTKLEAWVVDHSSDIFLGKAIPIFTFSD